MSSKPNDTTKVNKLRPDGSASDKQADSEKPASEMHIAFAAAYRKAYGCSPIDKGFDAYNLASLASHGEGMVAAVEFAVANWPSFMFHLKVCAGFRYARTEPDTRLMKDNASTIREFWQWTSAEPAKGMRFQPEDLEGIPGFEPQNPPPGVSGPRGFSPESDAALDAYIKTC